MVEKRGIDLIDYLIILVKRKILLISIFIVVFIVSYLFIYLFIGEEFRAKALIIPANDDQVSSLSSVLKGFSNLPMGLGGLKEGASTDLYKTIIYSRTNLEAVIHRFDLMKEYHLQSLEKTISELESRIETKETKESAFEISVLASSRKKSAEITNFIVDKLNEAIIQLNIRKSKENRVFLEKRYAEIKENLKNSEDSLRAFQEKSKMLVAEDQTKAIIETLSRFESDLAAKQIELGIYEKIFGPESPQTKNAKISVEEYKLKLNSLKKGTENSSFLLAINSIPKESLIYYRLYRDVMINNSMLEVIIPLYENARFQEEKETPILQVIDYAVPPELKAYPKRLFLSLVITLIVIFIVSFFIVIKDVVNNTKNPKIIFLINELDIRKKN